ncbi:hypothetical protein BRD56_01300 [Thermoplasmatales archaeon SW_10_69_26]|nr:MAG: hypothetical protein BRD56_01300 [Thermoplasmatales archaeon SW_10_69_26]
MPSARGPASATRSETIEVLEDGGLEHEVGPSGTTILGGWDEGMATLERCNEALGAPETRVNTVIEVDAKPGLDPGDIEAKVDRGTGP